ncbi:hypothetical protein [Bacillus sp. USDA818B3_A]|uniref:hypothetical protein n=1 Tax=Bacillus sp. USDA818B3_A TaxID=2698834 RepID=UPI001367EF51|nr:hypothetical protein [Bacillus sp. USDA818B3_A]
MAVVKSVKIDGENIHLFNSAIYVFAASTGFTLELDIIVSEVAVKKYKKENNLFVEIDLEDGESIHSIMQVKVLSGGLPQLNLFCEIDDPDDYSFLDRVNEDDAWFPNIEEGITLEQIREVEMPNEDISVKVKLPIDQVEWLKKQKKAKLNELLKEFIYEHWKRQD